MTEESQDGTTQQLSESDKADEKPTQDNRVEETEQNSGQLASTGNNLFISPSRVSLNIVFIFDRFINTILKDRYSTF